MAESLLDAEERTVDDGLDTVGDDLKKRRGRPSGSKNKGPTESSQKKILAGAIVALFAILGFLMKFFDWEYWDEIKPEEAEEGGTYLIPISSKIGWIAAVATYLSFPAWFLFQFSKRFRVKKDKSEAPAKPAVGVSGQPGSGPADTAPSDSAPEAGRFTMSIAEDGE